jgi:hypothetical protein
LNRVGFESARAEHSAFIREVASAAALNIPPGCGQVQAVRTGRRTRKTMRSYGGWRILHSEGGLPVEPDPDDALDGGVPLGAIHRPATVDMAIEAGGLLDPGRESRAQLGIRRRSRTGSATPRWNWARDSPRGSHRPPASMAMSTVAGRWMAPSGTPRSRASPGSGSTGRIPSGSNPPSHSCASFFRPASGSQSSNPDRSPAGHSAPPLTWT